jgi:hypothetical protein
MSVDPRTADRTGQRQVAIRAALKTEDVEIIDYALSRSVQCSPTPFPSGRHQTIIDELGKNCREKSRFESYVDLRALSELEKKGSSSRR